MTSTPESKRRGRPTGSGQILKMDKPRLAKMADYMVANPDSDVVDAVRAVLPTANESDEHRLRRKFRDQREALIADAEARAKTKVAESTVTTSAGFGHVGSPWASFLTGSSITRRLLEGEEKRQRLIDAAYGGAAMRRLNEMMEREEKIRKVLQREEMIRQVTRGWH